MKLKPALFLAAGILGFAFAPSSARAQDASNCVTVQWKQTYKADFVYDNCSQSLTVAFATPDSSGLVASSPGSPAIVYEEPGSSYKYWACAGPEQPIDNETHLIPTYDSTSVSCK